MSGKKWIAVLDDRSRLVGRKQVAENVEGIDFGDLPTNGIYKWDAAQSTFVPLGHGFPKVRNGVPPHTLETVIARLIETMGETAPSEAVEWLTWYNSDLRVREQEMQESRGIRGRR